VKSTPRLSQSTTGTTSVSGRINFCAFRPRKNAVNLEVKIPRTEEVDAKIEGAGIEALGYSRWGAYQLSLERDDIAKNRGLLKEMMQAAYNIRAA
jgi:hypothetical protein